MSFKCDRVPGLPLFDTPQSQKNINGKDSKILFNVFLMHEKNPGKLSHIGNKL